MSEKGFTIIEIAIVLIIIGIIIGGAMKFTGIIESAKGKKVVADVTALVDAQNRYFERVQRLAGDADNNGIIDFENLSSAAPDNSAADSGDADYAFDELKTLSIMPSTGTNTLLSSTQGGAYMYYSGYAPASGQPLNMIVIRNAECAAAFAMELNMDNSSADSENSASSGRVRMIDGDDLAADGTTWTSSGTDCVVGGEVSSTARTNISYIIGNF